MIRGPKANHKSLDKDQKRSLRPLKSHAPRNPSINPVKVAKIALNTITEGLAIFMVQLDDAFQSLATTLAWDFVIPTGEAIPDPSCGIDCESCHCEPAAKMIRP
jgi:hypothetical protein